jgi:tRNA (guanine37-N1)-methyltransferase
VNLDVFTLFPGWFGWFTEQRHVRNALAEGLELDFVDLRATTPLRAGQVDDTPYGGGAGMVIRVDVVEAALEARYGPVPAVGPGGPGQASASARASVPAGPTAPESVEGGSAQRRVVALAPGGRQFDDALADELAREPALTLLCGRYEGFDERVNTHLATDVVSIGPYVLAGGELAAMVVCDAVIRKLPGALGHVDSALEESFSPALEGAPEYPHYTRPLEWRGHRVPDVLLSGDHARVAAWRMAQSRERGRARAGEE